MNRFKRRKKPSKRKLIILLLVLLGILYFWMNAERILGDFMSY